MRRWQNARSSFMESNPGSNFVIRKLKYDLRQAFRLLFPLLQALNVISQDFLGRAAENLMPFSFIVRKVRKKGTSNSTTQHRVFRLLSTWRGGGEQKRGMKEERKKGREKGTKKESRGNTCAGNFTFLESLVLFLVGWNPYLHIAVSLIIDAKKVL